MSKELPEVWVIEEPLLTDPRVKDIIKWIVNHVDSYDVPQDEGNTDALVFNLVSKCLVGECYEPYSYEPCQDEWLFNLYKLFRNEKTR